MLNPIYRNRAEEEDVMLSDESLAILAKIGEDTSLRYAMRLITFADLVCKKRKGTEVEKEDVQKVYTMFLDEERSSEYLKEYHDEYMFSETPEGLLNSYIEFLS